MNPNFDQYTRQNAIGIIFIFVKEIVSKIKQFWFVIAAILITKNNDNISNLLLLKALIVTTCNLNKYY